jgi:hypothetical protein
MFERLLKALPDIASAVNQFESATVQEQAFEALVRALGLAEPPPAAAPAVAGMDFATSANGDLNGEAGEVETETTTTTTRRRRRPASTAVSADRDIDFRPAGKQSFRDFVAEKKPATNDERNLIAVYYLEQILGMSRIGASHVLAAYKDCNWREPASPVNSLQVTASRKNWLNTADITAIRTTPPGRNMVEHDMPLPAKK